MVVEEDTGTPKANAYARTLARTHALTHSRTHALTSTHALTYLEWYRHRRLRPQHLRCASAHCHRHHRRASLGQPAFSACTYSAKRESTARYKSRRKLGNTKAQHSTQTGRTDPTTTPDRSATTNMDSLAVHAHGHTLALACARENDDACLHIPWDVALHCSRDRVGHRFGVVDANRLVVERKPLQLPQGVGCRHRLVKNNPRLACVRNSFIHVRFM